MTGGSAGRERTRGHPVVGAEVGRAGVNNRSARLQTALFSASHLILAQCLHSVHSFPLPKEEDSWEEDTARGKANRAGAGSGDSSGAEPRPHSNSPVGIPGSHGSTHGCSRWDHRHRHNASLELPQPWDLPRCPLPLYQCVPAVPTDLSPQFRAPLQNQVSTTLVLMQEPESPWAICPEEHQSWKQAKPRNACSQHGFDPERWDISISCCLLLHGREPRSPGAARWVALGGQPGQEMTLELLGRAQCAQWAPAQGRSTAPLVVALRCSGSQTPLRVSDGGGEENANPH